MNRRAFRCLNPSVLVLGLLVTSWAGAAVAEESPQLNPRVNAAFPASAPTQATTCVSCALAHQQCFATCFAETEKERMGGCLTACNNAAATCTCDEPVTLRSEDLVEQGFVSFSEFTSCNPVVSCQPGYPSCASWSSYSGCGEPFCDLEEECEDCSHCDPEIEFPECLCNPGPAHHEIFERFRVCHNQFAEPCVEWQRTVGFLCGCNEL